MLLRCSKIVSNSCRNQFAKFEIDRKIPDMSKQRLKPSVMDRQTNYNNRKATLKSKD